MVGAELSVTSEVRVVSEFWGDEGEQLQAAVAEQEELADGSTVGVVSV